MTQDGTTIGEGVTIGNFELPDHAGIPYELHARLADGPQIVVLYRGDW